MAPAVWSLSNGWVSILFQNITNSRSECSLYLLLTFSCLNFQSCVIPYNNRSFLLLYGITQWAKLLCYMPTSECDSKSSIWHFYQHFATENAMKQDKEFNWNNWVLDILAPLCFLQNIICWAFQLSEVFLSV